jgi:nucleoside-diphosphate-sugar epimerase
MSKGTVLVTGAMGTVGQYAVGELLACGYKVRATDICYSGGEFALSDGDYSYEQGDLCDPEFASQVVRGTDYIIHLAADIDVGKSWKQLVGINLDAVRLLYNAAATVGVKGFVHLSSGSIYAQTKSVRDENTRIKTSSEASPYEWTKIRSEAALLGDWAAIRVSGRYAPEVVIIRPALIYGPRNKYLAANYLSIAVILHELFGKAAPRLCGGPKTNMVHAEDVARAAIFCMERVNTWGQTFNVADDSPWGFGDQVSAMMDAFGYPTSVKLPLPGASIIGLASPLYERRAVLGVLNKALGFEWERIAKSHGLKPPFGPKIDLEMTGFFGNNTIFGNGKLKTAGFTLKHPDFAEGMRDVAEWYMTNGWAPRPQLNTDGLRTVFLFYTYSCQIFYKVVELNNQIALSYLINIKIIAGL